MAVSTEARVKAEHTGDPEDDARALLDVVWPGGASEPLLPVDPIFIATKIGLDVYVADLDSDISGMLVMRRAGEDPAIYLQQSDSRNRQRFTCGHELGHYVASGGGDGMAEQVEHRALLATQGTNPDEIYANQFAAALLMPAQVVQARWQKMPLPAILAAEFGVSGDAMNYRVANLGLK